MLILGLLGWPAMDRQSMVSSKCKQSWTIPLAQVRISLATCKNTLCILLARSEIPLVGRGISPKSSFAPWCKKLHRNDKICNTVTLVSKLVLHCPSIQPHATLVCTWTNQGVRNLTDKLLPLALRSSVPHLDCEPRLTQNYDFIFFFSIT